MAFTFKGFIFKLFPYYFKEQDTLKDSSDRGLLERYIKNFEDEIDEQMFVYLRDFVNIFNTITTDEKYLPYLSYFLGSPPSANGDLTIYRKILAYAVKIAKLKGTTQSFQLLFNLYGLEVSIIEAIPLKGSHYDDPDVTYDPDNDKYHYDQECDNCSCYQIVYQPIGQADNILHIDLTVPDEIITLIGKIVCYIQPINANLCGIYRKITFADELHIELEDDGNIILAERLQYVNFLNNPLDGGPVAPDVKAAYAGNQWDDDVDQVYAYITDEGNGVYNAIKFYVVYPDNTTLVSEWIYGVPVDNEETFIAFLHRWFSNNVTNSSLQDAGDFLYPINPLGDLYFASYINLEELLRVEKLLIGHDTLIPMTGCPNPAYPIAVYAIDDTIIGVAADADDLAKIWNSYAPNKLYGYLEHKDGCTFNLYRRADETHIMAGDIKGQFVTVGPDGDFNEDFEINPGGDFY